MHAADKNSTENYIHIFLFIMPYETGYFFSSSFSLLVLWRKVKMVSLSRNKYMAVKFMDPIALYLIVIVVVAAAIAVELLLQLKLASFRFICNLL